METRNRSDNVEFTVMFYWLVCPIKIQINVFVRRHVEIWYNLSKVFVVVPMNHRSKVPTMTFSEDGDMETFGSELPAMFDGMKLAAVAAVLYVIVRCLNLTSSPAAPEIISQDTPLSRYLLKSCPTLSKEWVSHSAYSLLLSLSFPLNHLAVKEDTFL